MSVCFPGKMTTPFTGPYTATKFAVNGFFGTMQHELAMQRSNVSVTISTLGLIDTDSAMEKIRSFSHSLLLQHLLYLELLPPIL